MKEKQYVSFPLSAIYRKYSSPAFEESAQVLYPLVSPAGPHKPTGPYLSFLYAWHFHLLTTTHF